MSKKIAQIATDYTFLKSPWPSKFKCAKTFENIQSLNVYSRKTENVQIPFKFAAWEIEHLGSCHLGSRLGKMPWESTIHSLTSNLYLIKKLSLC